jgi:drug/metabolite transporter (DMT)-like permease
MYLGIVAVRYANTSVLGPYTLLRLVIGIVGGLLIFNERPDLWSGVGSLLILVSCLLSARPSRGRAALPRGQLAQRI